MGVYLKDKVERLILFWKGKLFASVHKTISGFPFKITKLLCTRLNSALTEPNKQRRLIQTGLLEKSRSVYQQITSRMVDRRLCTRQGWRFHSIVVVLVVSPRLSVTFERTANTSWLWATADGDIHLPGYLLKARNIKIQSIQTFSFGWQHLSGQNLQSGILLLHDRNLRKCKSFFQWILPKEAT